MCSKAEAICPYARGRWDLSTDSPVKGCVVGTSVSTVSGGNCKVGARRCEGCKVEKATGGSVVVGRGVRGTRFWLIHKLLHDTLPWQVLFDRTFEGTGAIVLIDAKG